MHGTDQMDNASSLVQYPVADKMIQATAAGLVEQAIGANGLFGFIFMDRRRPAVKVPYPNAIAHHPCPLSERHNEHEPILPA